MSSDTLEGAFYRATPHANGTTTLHGIHRAAGKAYHPFVRRVSAQGKTLWERDLPAYTGWTNWVAPLEAANRSVLILYGQKVGLTKQFRGRWYDTNGILLRDQLWRTGVSVGRAFEVREDVVAIGSEGECSSAKAAVWRFDPWLQDSCTAAGACDGKRAPACDDGDPCTVDACDGKAGCVSTKATCDDGDACTLDGCTQQAGCTHQPNSCSATMACRQCTCRTTIGSDWVLPPTVSGSTHARCGYPLHSRGCCTVCSQIYAVSRGREMKMMMSIVGGVLGFLVGVGTYLSIMMMVFESENFSTKIGGLFAIGGAIAVSSLMHLITGKNAKTASASGSQTITPTADDIRREERLWAAVVSQDHNAIVGFRDVIQPQDIAPLAARWSQTEAWPIKDALLALLTDQTAQKYPVLEPIFRDGLNSPNPDVRCYAYCSLTGDFASFVELHEGDDTVFQNKLRARGLA